jgi:hypothetical protein
MLMFDPVGLGVQTEWMAGAPFNSFVAPGLILFVFIGLLPALIAWGLLRKPEWPVMAVFNIYRDRHWAWTCSLYEGIILIVWITVQLTMVPGFWLQPLYLGVGVLILILTLWPGVMRYYLLAEK